VHAAERGTRFRRNPVFSVLGRVFHSLFSLFSCYGSHAPAASIFSYRINLTAFPLRLAALLNAITNIYRVGSGAGAVPYIIKMSLRAHVSRRYPKQLKEAANRCQLEQVQTTGPRNQTVHHTVHTSSSIGIATSCMRQVQQDTAASATALVCVHASCPAGHIPAVSAGSEVLVNFTSRNQRDHAR
jgi:hypothetical protein